MTREAFSGFQLYAALKEVGMPLPEDVVHLEIKCESDALVQLRIVCNLNAASLHQLGQAMQLLAVQQRLT